MSSLSDLTHRMLAAETPFDAQAILDEWLVPFVNEVIAPGEMLFKKDIPHFCNLQDYIQHVSNIREQQRREQRTKLSALIGEQK